MNLKEFVVKAFDQNRNAVLYITGTGLAFLGLGLGYKYLRKQKKLTRVGVVSQLIVHPLKSGKGVLVEAAECQRMGLKYGQLQDRHWLVITEEGQMVTGRQEPSLVLVSLTIEGGDVCLNGPDMEELRVPFHQPNNDIYNCRVYGSDIQGRDCGEEAFRWLTRYLATDKTFRLVHYEPQMKPRRPVDRASYFPQDDKVAYPNTGPVMLMSEASVKDLNSRLKNDVTAAQFRPSIVVSDCKAFHEDFWDDVQIGNVQMQRIMACGRCLNINVDPETGVMSSKEPLDSLRTYRDPEQCDPGLKCKNKNAPLFGEYYTVKKTGILHVGDPVYKMSY